jgi:uncharacterized protein
MTMETSKIKVPSSKGTIAAVIHYPEVKTGQLAILCPGYLDSKDHKHLVELAESLSKQGYVVVRFDPTGTWESDGSIADYTIEQQFGDVRNILEYMIVEGGYKHVLLGGHSGGGFISILYAIRDPRISIVLGIMPPYSLVRTLNKMKNVQWQKEGYILSLKDVPGKNKKKEFRVSYSNMKSIEKYNVLDEVNKLRVPIILIAGGNDDLIPPGDVKLIFDKANEPKKFILIKDIGHSYRHNDQEIKIVNKHVLDQLTKLDQ